MQQSFYNYKIPIRIGICSTFGLAADIAPRCFNSVSPELRSSTEEESIFVDMSKVQRDEGINCGKTNTWQIK